MMVKCFTDVWANTPQEVSDALDGLPDDHEFIINDMAGTLMAIDKKARYRISINWKEER